MGRDIDYSKFNIDELREMSEEEDFELENFEKIGRKKRFDDGTAPSKTGKKKQKVQRGGKEDALKDSDKNED